MPITPLMPTGIAASPVVMLPAPSWFAKYGEPVPETRTLRVPFALLTMLPLKSVTLTTGAVVNTFPARAPAAGVTSVMLLGAPGVIWNPVVAGESTSFEVNRSS